MKLGKVEQIKFKEGKWQKKALKTRAQINEKENRKIIEKSNKTKNQ